MSFRRTSRKSAPPQRYEPDEMPEDDISEQGDDMPSQSESLSQDSRSTGSLKDFLTSDDELEPDSDVDDPDWEMDSADDCSSDMVDEDDDID